MYEVNARPQVILSANIPHYYYDALAFQEAGILKRYLCAIGTSKSNRWIGRLLPLYWRKKLQGRDVSRIDPSKVRAIWLPELLQKGLPRMGLASQERADWINNHLYDWLASRWVDGCDLFHFVASVGLYSARKAKKRGSIIICSERTEFPDFQRRILCAEYQKLGIPYDPVPTLYDRKVKAEYALADYLIVPSSYAKRTFVEAGFREDRVFQITYGVNLEEFRPGPRRTPNDLAEGGDAGGDTFRIVYSGQIIPRKGLHYLIRAFEELGLPDSELLLIGHLDASMKPLVERALRLNPRIRLAGNVPRLELYRHYSVGSVFVLPSLSDSFGLVCLEAMACGLPVITTDHTGSHELIREGTDGFTVPVRDVEALKERLLLLYRNPRLREQMSESARSRVQAFTWKRYGETLIDIYREILRRERRSGR